MEGLQKLGETIGCWLCTISTTECVLTMSGSSSRDGKKTELETRKLKMQCNGQTHVHTWRINAANTI